MKRLQEFLNKDKNDIIKKVKDKIRRRDYVLSNAEWKKLLTALENVSSDVRNEILGHLSGEGKPADKQAEKNAVNAAEDFLAYTKEGRPVVRTKMGYNGKPDKYDIM